MQAPALPANESPRLQALRSLGLLDTQNEERFSRYVRLAKSLIDVPIATISLVDSNRQWFKGCEGLEMSETPRNISFCGHAILEQGVFYIPDAAADARFADNPLVTGAPHIRFYAGCPVYVPGNLAIGTLCVMDRRPRTLTPELLGRLRDLADCLQRELSLHVLLQDIQRLKSSPALTALAQHG
ncbi:GAF domain-containing protein [Lysobacter korlensis]|uniref:GAF domain-containing protein n=1 Tax=Lysobacter korlensis TaxID=553636 RepID=A0ABV6RJ88_9GAMM